MFTLTPAKMALVLHISERWALKRANLEAEIGDIQKMRLWQNLYNRNLTARYKLLFAYLEQREKRK
jgi:hypothetical protein